MSSWLLKKAAPTSITTDGVANVANPWPPLVALVHHLDLALSEYRPSGKPRGLIGQTVELRYGSDGKAIMEGAGCIEGVEDDYIVSGLNAAKLSNSPFNEGSSFSASADGVAADGAKRT